VLPPTHPARDRGARVTLYVKSYQVQWRDLDANRHMANTAFLDYGTQTRFRYFESRGLGPDRLIEAGTGVVLFTELIEYKAELRFLEEFTVDVRLGGMNEKGSRFEIVNRVTKADGALAAVMTIHAGWFDLAARKVRSPSAEMAAALDGLVRTGEYRAI
jgi:acyl-CoA thioester hydrolase